MINSRVDDPGYELERAQNLIELVMAIVVPVLISLMLFSYVIFRELFETFFILAILVACLTVWPAKKAHDLHYTCWAVNNMPLKIITGFVGMIYISVVSVFAVSMIALYEGLRPENPLTLGIIASLLFVLLVVMAYSSKYRDRFLATERRFFRRDATFLEKVVCDYLENRGEKFAKYPDQKNRRVVIEDKGLAVSISPLWNGASEVAVENIDLKNVDVFNSLKETLKALA